METFPKINGDITVVINLLNSGVDINTKYWHSKTLLHHASRKNWFDIVKYLVKSGADIEARDSTNGNTPLHHAAIKNNIEIVKYLIEHGADIHARSVLYNTPLHRAAYGKNFETVKYLLDCGADKTLRNREGNGETAYSNAKERGAHEIALYIEEFESVPTKGVHCDQ